MDQNRVQAAPVVGLASGTSSSPSRRRSSINSGVANAATGEQGERDALRPPSTTAALLGLAPEQVLVLSTGVIGAPLPMDRILAGLDAAAAALSRTAAPTPQRRS